MYQVGNSGSNIRVQASPFLVRSAAHRLAVYIVSMIDCDHDLKTVTGWAKHAHASSSTIREHCRISQIKPHIARDFGRVLRAVCRSGRTWVPETVLDCADTRTLNKLMKSAGLTCKRGSTTPSIREFLKGQRWIPQDHPVMPIVGSVLREVGLQIWERRSASTA